MTASTERAPAVNAQRVPEKPELHRRFGRFYVFLGATTLGIAGILGIAGGLPIIGLIETQGRLSFLNREGVNARARPRCREE
jgi:hypothetical protein